MKNNDDDNDNGYDDHGDDDRMMTMVVAILMVIIYGCDDDNDDVNHGEYNALCPIYLKCVQILYYIFIRRILKYCPILVFSTFKG